ncbi:hypothetical protein [Thermoflexibacter ruber]|uniref:Uncharacterized protein n=1 Tax=Thermoflexibacter ruber TaxID=1003 RepID=A0A1I2KDV6_9BACT|nr:hypothetical protein [Thermoflexibacter ruber]SFF64663.1 hypothetical protein SAMN04488541_11102 [Thermoflexibacter ruber]
MKSKLKKIGIAIFILMLTNINFVKEQEVKAQTGGCVCYFSVAYGCSTGGSTCCLMCDGGAPVVKPKY